MQRLREDIEHDVEDDAGDREHAEPRRLRQLLEMPMVGMVHLRLLRLWLRHRSPPRAILLAWCPLASNRITRRTARVDRSGAPMI